MLPWLSELFVLFYVCVYSRMHYRGHTMYKGQGSTLGAGSQKPMTLVFETLAPAKLADQQAPGVCLSLPSQCDYCQHKSSLLAFYVGSGDPLIHTYTYTASTS